MKDNQADIDYWNQMVFDWGLRAQSQSPSGLILAGTSRELSLNSPTLGGWQTFNMGLSCSRVSTWTKYLLPQLQWMRPQVLVQGGPTNDALIVDQTDPEYVNFYFNFLTYLQAAKPLVGKLVVCNFMPLEIGNSTIGCYWDASTLAPSMDEINGAVRSCAATVGATFCDIAGISSGTDKTALPGSTIDQVHYSAPRCASVIAAINAALASA